MDPSCRKRMLHKLYVCRRGAGGRRVVQILTWLSAHRARCAARPPAAAPPAATRCSVPPPAYDRVHDRVSDSQARCAVLCVASMLGSRLRPVRFPCPLMPFHPTPHPLPSPVVHRSNACLRQLGAAVVGGLQRGAQLAVGGRLQRQCRQPAGRCAHRQPHEAGKAGTTGAEQ